jgi:hypothetical protein
MSKEFRTLDGKPILHRRDWHKFYLRYPEGKSYVDAIKDYVETTDYLQKRALELIATKTKEDYHLNLSLMMDESEIGLVSHSGVKLVFGKNEGAVSIHISEPTRPAA